MNSQDAMQSVFEAELKALEEVDLDFDLSERAKQYAGERATLIQDLLDLNNKSPVFN